MSSHHFVREGQEPALLILDAVPFSRVAPFLEWSPTVIVDSSAFHQAVSWGIKVDVLLSASEVTDDLDPYLQQQAPVKVFFSGNDDLLEKAFRFLNRSGNEAVNICCKHSQKLLMRLFDISGKLQVTVLDEYAHWRLISASGFSKWIEAGTVLKILPKYEDQKFHITGLKREGHMLTAQMDGLISIQSAGPFWVLE